MTVTTRVTAPPNSYTLVLPPGWKQIPLRQGTDDAVRRILDLTFESFPRDEVFTYRRDLEKRLALQIRQARDAAGLDLYLPVELMHGIPVAASILVSEVSFGSVEDIDPDMVALRLATAADGSETVLLDGAIAVRTDRVAAADPARQAEFPSRRVDFVISVPQDPDRWLAVVFSTIGAGDPYDEMSELLVGLFDAIMSTFRWENR